MGMTSTLLIQSTASLTPVTAQDIGEVKYTLAHKQELSLATGVAADQADMVFTDERTLSSAATEDLDLAGGLTNALGSAITFVKIKELIVLSDPTNTTNLTIGNATTQGWIGPFGGATHTLTIKPKGGVAIW